jgi:hypothetical protein
MMWALPGAREKHLHKKDSKKQSVHHLSTLNPGSNFNFEVHKNISSGLSKIKNRQHVAQSINQ